MKVLISLLRSVKWFLNTLIRPVFLFLKKYFDYAYLTYYGVETQLGYVTLKGLPIIHKHPNGRIIVGSGVTLVSKSKYNSAGVNHPVILAAIRDGALLHIKGSFGASGSAIVAMNSIVIEEGAGLGANSHVYDTDFHSIAWHKSEDINTAPVHICKNVWVAASCLILKGVTIGENSTIGAGSVVTKDVDANSLYAGVPAKFLRSIN